MRVINIFFRGESAVAFRFSSRSLVAVRDREKEKPTEFANGSLLRNDSRNFCAARIRFPGRAFPPAPPHRSACSPKFHHPQIPVYFISSLSTLLLLDSASSASSLPPARPRTFPFADLSQGSSKIPLPPPLAPSPPRTGSCDNGYCDYVVSPRARFLLHRRSLSSFPSSRNLDTTPIRLPDAPYPKLPRVPRAR